MNSMTNMQRDNYMRKFMQTFNPEKIMNMSEYERTGYFMLEFPRLLDGVWQDGYTEGKRDKEREMIEKLN